MKSKFLQIRAGSRILAGIPEAEFTARCGCMCWIRFIFCRMVFGLSEIPYLAVEPVTHAGENRLISAWRYSDAVYSWSWEGQEGKTTEVLVYSSAYEVELLQDQTSLDRKKTEACKAVFQATYRPGVLLAVSYNEQGEETGRDMLCTAEKETVIRAVLEKEVLTANGQDLCYLDLSFCDKNGIVKASCEEVMSVTVTGAGNLEGFGNASPYTETRFDQQEHPMYYGRGLAVIRAGVTPGKIQITVSAKDCETKYLEIQVTEDSSDRRFK